MISKTLQQELGEFLRSRRLRLSPREVGLPARGRRRTPGLRREEVAELTGISVDWYARLEQGRHSCPSRSTVEALADTLRLDATDRVYLRRLALEATERPFKTETVGPELAEMVRQLPGPAYVVGARFDVLCWNEAAAEVFYDFEAIPLGERNTLYLIFASARARSLFVRWESEAQALLESFRNSYAFWSQTPAFVELQQTLSALSPDFKRWWTAHNLRNRASGEKLINHPTKGLLRLNFVTLQMKDNPDLRLILHSRPQRLKKLP